LTAGGIICRLRGGESPRRNKVMDAGEALLLADLPEWDEKETKIDVLYWWHGATACRLRGTTPWNTWEKAMHKALLPNQLGKETGSAMGSWNSGRDAWGEAGGRVYMTAVAVLALQTPYRVSD
jgi:hypothetical protein